jgi:hypothetical protein
MNELFYINILLYFCYTFISGNFVSDIILNKKFKKMSMNTIFNNLIKISYVIYLINAYHYSNPNSETYVVSLISSIMIPILYYLYYYKNTKQFWISQIEHFIPLIILLIFNYDMSNYKFGNHSLIMLIIYIYYFSKRPIIYDDL